MGEERLDSWKEIASYLERDERTVQRWEIECKLPVHRLPGRKRGGVYAFRRELDVWRARGQETAAESPESLTASSGDSGGLRGLHSLAESSNGHDQSGADHNGNAPNTATATQPALSEPRSAIVAGNRGTTRRFILILIIITASLAVALLGFGAIPGALFFTHRSGRTNKIEMQRLTFRHGSIRAARFRPDGRNVIYGAKWNGQPLELFESPVDRPEPFLLQIADSQLLAISSRSMLAILSHPQPSGPFVQRGTLAIRGLYTGQPQTIAANVSWADWSSDGSSIAYTVLDPGSGSWIEIYSIDLHQVRRLSPAMAGPSDWFSHVRFSPTGKYIAFEEHWWGRDDGRTVILDLSSGAQINSRNYDSIYGLAWRPSGDELWFTAAETGLSRSIWGMDVRGVESLVYQAPANLTLQDISNRGDVLLTRDLAQSAILIEKLDSDRAPTDLSLFDWAILGDLSRDGKQVVFAEVGDAVRTPALFLRDTSGSATTFLGNASTPAAISTSGDAVLAVTNGRCPQVILFPRDQPSRIVTRHGLCVDNFFWRSASQFAFTAIDEKGKELCYTQKIGEPDAVAFAPDDFSCALPSPDRKYALAFGGGVFFRATIDGTSSRESNLTPAHRPVGWLNDNRIAVIQSLSPFILSFVDVESGRSQAVPVKIPSDIESVVTARISADGRTVAYRAYRLNSDLYFLHGLK